MYIGMAHISGSRTQSCGPTPLQGGLGNTVQLCVQEERERVLAIARPVPWGWLHVRGTLGWVELSTESTLTSQEGAESLFSSFSGISESGELLNASSIGRLLG